VRPKRLLSFSDSLPQDEERAPDREHCMRYITMIGTNWRVDLIGQAARRESSQASTESFEKNMGVWLIAGSRNRS
jgi:hypothetical protein